MNLSQDVSGVQERGWKEARSGPEGSMGRPWQECPYGVKGMMGDPEACHTR